MQKNTFLMQKNTKTLTQLLKPHAKIPYYIYISIYIYEKKKEARSVWQNAF